MQLQPKTIELIGSTLAIVWENNTESYIDEIFLRAHSPSAENVGEVDILGIHHGNKVSGDLERFRNVKILTWKQIGNYALRFIFSDGHSTGLYTYKYIFELAITQNICI